MNTRSASARLPSAPAFPPDEFKLLAAWFGFTPDGSPLPDPESDEVEQLLTDLGYEEEPSVEIYRRLDTAVASILLEAIEGRLPNYGVIRSGGEVVLSRESRSRGRRSVSLLAQHLFSMDWAMARR